MKVIIFGCGREAERFISAWDDVLEIEYCLNNYAGSDAQKQFHGYQVYKPDTDNVHSGIVVTPAYYYKDISKQLSGFGLHENIDFWGINEFISYMEKKGEIPERKTKRIGFIGFAKNFDIYNN